MVPAIYGMWNVKVNRVENLAEEHSDKVDTMRLDQNIGNVIKKLALTFESDWTIDIFCMDSV